MFIKVQLKRGEGILAAGASYSPPKEWTVALTPRLMGKGEQTGQARFRQIGMRAASGTHTDPTRAVRSGYGGRESVGSAQEVPFSNWFGASWGVQEAG